MLVVYIYQLNSETFKHCVMERYSRNEYIHWFNYKERHNILQLINLSFTGKAYFRQHYFFFQQIFNNVKHRS